MIRPYQSDDLDAVVGIYVQAVHILAASHYTRAERDAWAPATPDRGRWRQRLAELRVLVAEREGRAAGFAGYRDDGYVDLLFVHPEFARRGVATSLIRRIAEDRSAAGITVLTTHASLAARDFFERQGFQVAFEETVECRGERLRRYQMSRPL